LHQPHFQQLSLDRDVGGIGFRSGRPPMLAPQEAQVGNAALVEREDVTLPLDHSFGFELADVGPAAIEVQRQRGGRDRRSMKPPG
jgi:hypothetical protein